MTFHKRKRGSERRGIFKGLSFNLYYLLNRNEMYYKFQLTKTYKRVNNNKNFRFLFFVVSKKEQNLSLLYIVEFVLSFVTFIYGKGVTSTLE